MTMAAANRALPIGALVAGLMLAPALAKADLVEVGTAAAVNPDATGTPPGAQTRQLLMGTDVFFEERIRTQANGQTQVLFLDESTLTVAPNSDLVLDRFVYDPESGAGTLSITLTTGLLRYVGGKISKKGAVTINTPAATVGVRGGMADISVTGTARQQTSALGGTDVAQGGAGEPTTTINVNFGVVEGTTANGEDFQLTDPTQALVISPSAIETVDAAPIVANNAKKIRGTNTTVVVTAENTEAGLESTGGGASTEPPVSAATATEAAATAGATGGGEDPTGTVEAIGDTANVSETTQNQASENAAETGLNIAGPIAGNYQATPDPFTTDFGDPVNPVPANVLGGLTGSTFNRPFTSSSVVDGMLMADTDGVGGVDTVLPFQAGTNTFGAAGTTTPFAFTSGTSFVDVDTLFYTYALTGGARNQFLFGGTPTPNGGILPAPASFFVDTYELAPDPFEPSSIPFIPANIASQFTDPQVTDFIIGHSPGSPIGDATAPFDDPTLWMAFDIEGQGASQRSIFVMSAGSEFVVGGKNTLSEGIRGFYRPDGNTEAIRFGNSIGSEPLGTGDHFIGPNQEYFVLSHSGTDTDPLDLEEDAGFVIPFGPFENYGFTHVAEKIPTPAGFVGTRGDNVWNGYAAGLMESNFGDAYVVRNETDSPTDLRIETFGSTSTIEVLFDFQNPNVLTDGSDVSGGRFAWGGEGAFRGSYIDDHNWGARNLNSQTTDAVDPEFRNSSSDPIVAQTTTFQPFGFRSAIAVHDPIPPDEAFPNVTFCQCDYLKWGYWSADFAWSNTEGNNPNINAGRRERGHINTFVAGDLPNPADVFALSGTATFNGHGLFNIDNNGVKYIDAADFQQSWDFGLRSGTVTVTGLDGHDFASAANGITAPMANARDFTGTITSTSDATRSGDLQGSFFSGPQGPATYSGGQITITDSNENYLAAGTFAAEQ